MSSTHAPTPLSDQDARELFGRSTAAIRSDIAQAGGPHAYLTGLLLSLNGYAEICGAAAAVNPAYGEKALRTALWVAETSLVSLPPSLFATDSPVPAAAVLSREMLCDAGLPRSGYTNPAGGSCALRAFASAMSRARGAVLHGPATGLVSDAFGEQLAFARRTLECTLSTWPLPAPARSAPEAERAETLLAVSLPKAAAWAATPRDALSSADANAAVALVSAALDGMRETQAIFNQAAQPTLEQAKDVLTGIVAVTLAEWRSAMHARQQPEAPSHAVEDAWRAVHLTAVACQMKAGEFAAAASGAAVWFETRQGACGNHVPVACTPAGEYVFTNGADGSGWGTTEASAWRVAGALSDRLVGHGRTTTKEALELARRPAFEPYEAASPRAGAAMTWTQIEQEIDIAVAASRPRQAARASASLGPC